MQTNFLDTPASLTMHILEREGCPIHYWTGGVAGALPVIFLHGGSLDHRMFNPQIEALVDQYRVLVWDARGHGRSQPMGNPFSSRQAVEDMIAIMDREGIEQAVMVGQSIGGIIAQHLYFEHPERVRGIVIIGAVPISKVYDWIEVALMRLSLRIFRLLPYRLLRWIIATFASPDATVRAYIRQSIGNMPRQNFLTFWESVTNSITTLGIPGDPIAVPLLLTHGKWDIVGTVQRDTWIWKQFEPDADYIKIPEAGHNANQDNPACFNRLLLNFLAVFAPQHE